MAETTIRIAAMLGMEPAGTSLRLRARDGENNVYCIELGEPMLGGLIAALLTQYRQVQPTGAVQPMTLNSGRPFRIGDGRIGLELTLDNGVRLPVLFPREAIPILRRTLDELERLATQSPPQRRPQ